MIFAATNDRRRVRLRQRIGQHYKTVSQCLAFGDLRLSFTRIENPDDVLDLVAHQVEEEEKQHGKLLPGEDVHLPYWAELWESSLALGYFLNGSTGRKLLGAEGRQSRRPPPPLPFPGVPGEGRRRPVAALDLGCGMGLAGAVAAGLGASVLFADMEPHALLFAQLNSLPWAGRVRTRRLNWRTDRLAERFDVIIGADILYESAQWPFLEAFWRQHLVEGGTVLLGEPGRPTGDEFVPWIKVRGWNLAEYAQTVATRAAPVRVLTLGISPSGFNPPARGT